MSRRKRNRTQPVPTTPLDNRRNRLMIALLVGMALGALVGGYLGVVVPRFLLTLGHQLEKAISPVSSAVEAAPLSVANAAFAQGHDGMIAHSVAQGTLLAGRSAYVEFRAPPGTSATWVAIGVSLGGFTGILLVLGLRATYRLFRAVAVTS